MAIDSKHPLYLEFQKDWEQMEDTYRGEKVVKSKGVEYLSATSGMVEDGMGSDQPGLRAYTAYKKRAVFHDFVSDAVEASLGMLHNKPPSITLPKSMEYMLEKATINGESLEHLLRRINERQLVTGRLGLLLDMPITPMAVPEPYIALYEAPTIINWDVGARGELTRRNLNLVVLDESENERDMEFQWVLKNKHRVLVLGDVVDNEGKNMGAVYRYGLFRAEESYNEAGLQIPTIRGVPSLEIPFVIINSKDVVPEPDDPPLLGLSNLCLAIYRGEADYRHSLFMQGQDTLVIIGGDKDEKVRVGANSVLHLPMTESDAKYIGVDSAGLTEQREALDNDKVLAAAKAGQFIRSKGRSNTESGEALSIRLSAETASLKQIALSGAQGLENLLKIGAVWMGADPEEVQVIPNTDFVNQELQSRTLVEYMTAKSLGAPISLETIHLNMQKKGLTELSFEQEMDKLANEAPTPTGNDDLDEEEEEEEEENQE